MSPQGQILQNLPAYFIPMAAIGWFWWLWLHPFFVSVAEISHNQAEKSLEISVRMFTDDFESALNTRFPGKRLDFYKPANVATLDSCIRVYLQESFALGVNGKKAAMNFIGHQREEESVWCFLEVTGVTELKKLQVTDRVLYEYKKEQINMVHVTAGGAQQSRKLENPEAEVVFSF